MKKVLSLVLLTLFICLPNKFYSQLITDGAGVGITVNGKSSFKNLSAVDPYYGNKFNYTTYDFWLPIPSFKLGKTRILGIINYRILDFTFDRDIEISPNYITKIQEIKPTLVVRHPFGERWAAFGVFIPTIASDFKNSFSMNDMVFDGIFGVSRKFGEKSNLEIGIGPHVMYAFGKFLITPAISLDYKSNNGKWFAQIYWPRVNIFRNLGNNTQVGLAGSIDWTLHNLQNYKNYQGEEIDYAQFSAIHGGLQINQRLFDGFWLQLQGGLGFANKYTLFNAQNDTISNYKAKEMPYVKMMLSYRFGK
ncbi:DUF6268 family outer membrane beta-barrel protein [Flavobacterium sp. Fl-318]|uniref:DUF6268 family outer membrane beta-barrel protein n=1 Tax=Flavobacterium cupriresistens TaxID=2893885 RepID=A0ABU4R8A9_9FLAO|nr:MULTISPECIES: DUF6268 family outer membrane beta-barrel protein [unclassified Flavobacterium]MDX6188053.1 DUF6268 family outer membrane beta-barrel protein [Flavobacterium sp. Fl-318]UFH42027.1 DUF6268 family outer membrane beta-barrel protein [Flavobacterium sp. F-323]